jgi:hypothetical protein
MNKEKLKQKVLSGVAVIENNSTIEKLQEVLDYCFPDDLSSIEEFDCEYIRYFLMDEEYSNVWYYSDINYEEKEVIKVTDFFNDYPKQLKVKVDGNWRKAEIEFERDGEYFERLGDRYYFAHKEVKPLITEISKEDIKRVFACEEFKIV